MAGVVELSAAPRLGPLYRRAVLGALRRGGTFRRAGTDLPDTTFVLRDVHVDREHLADYARVCGYRLSDELPPTYPHVLAFPLSASTADGKAFNTKLGPNCGSAE